MQGNHSTIDSPRTEREVSPRPDALATAERRASAMAPTVFCPSTRVEQCLATNGAEEAR